MKTLEERVKEVVLETLRILPDRYSEELSAGDIPQWDSMTHVLLLQNIESAFNITLDVVDAIAIEDVGDLIETVRRYAAT